MKKRRTKGLPGRLFYYVSFILICSLFIKFYIMWLDSYSQMHPEIVEAQAAGYIEEQPLDGILLWDEQVIKAPYDGVLTYVSMLPRYVAKNEAVAALDGKAVKVSSPGFFIPALDGQEEKWIYSQLWPGFNPFPFFRPAVFIENGINIQKGARLGKLAPQPQTLRCIAYIDRTPFVERSIMRSSVLKIKTEPKGKARDAEVLTHENAEQKIKIYLSLPFFTPADLKSRAFSCKIVAGDMQGVIVPDTAVITRDGRQGVFLVQGSVTSYTEVEGFPADEEHFFITKGVLPGNRLILYADKNKEGIIRFW